MIETTGDDSPAITGFIRVNNDTNVADKKATGTSYNAPLTCIDFSTKSTLRTGLGLSSSVVDASIDLLPNCALAVFNTSYTNANFDNTGVYNKDAVAFPTTAVQALYCASCKPGYKAEYFNNQGNIVRKCRQITNCATGGMALNACETCATGYLHKYDNTNGIMWDECV